MNNIISIESDRELLELSAKAAGLHVKTWEGHSGTMCAIDDDRHGRMWMPLTDDGDALRLAVACKLLIDTDHCCAMPINRTGEAEGDWSDGMLDDDRGAATRLAIVRAAAEIGRAMP